MIIFIKYVVEPNETLVDIAQKFDTTPKDLISLNPILKFYFYPNQIVYVPHVIDNNKIKRDPVYCKYKGSKYLPGDKVKKSDGTCMECGIMGDWITIPCYVPPTPGGETPFSPGGDLPSISSQ